MQTGRLRARVWFERREATGTNVGGVIIAGGWTVCAGPVWARMRPVRGGEQVLAARLQGREIFEVTVRGSNDVRQVTTDDRLVDARDTSRTYNIHYISNPDERRRGYVFLCELGGVDG